MSNRFLTATEAAKRKGCTPRTVLRAAEEGEVNAMQPGREWFIKDDAKFRKWCEQGHKHRSAKRLAVARATAETRRAERRAKKEGEQT